jgi:Sortase and related acyltransferases
VYLESFLSQQEPNPYVPKANIYLRPAENRDVPGLLELCNWYIHNTALCADLESLTHTEMVQRIADSRQEKLPFIVAVERNNRHALDHRERVLGYALATDYMGQNTAGRHTVELEVLVSNGSKRLGSRCLMDKLLEVCDATYVPHWGYFFDSDLDERPGYSCGGRRTLARLIFTYCYPEDDLSEYQRVKSWLKETYNFHEQGVLKGVCVKFSKL